MDSTQLIRAYKARLEKIRAEMERQNVGALVLSLGADMPWLIGYQAMPLERLTALVVPSDGLPTLVIPALEAPRVSRIDECFKVRAWKEFEDPHDIVAGLISGIDKIGISDRTWAVSLLKLQTRSSATFIASSKVTSVLRSVKDEVELMLLREAAKRTDVVANDLIKGEIEILGRTEREISNELSERLIAEGLSKVNFAIVGSGTNSASPHHEPGGRIVGPNEAVVCDFGGEFRVDGAAGYCSDITRTVCTGVMPERFLELYQILKVAQQKQLTMARAGLSCQGLDEIGRSHIEECGYGEYFIHRTGHGIGIEEHEDPYIVSGNTENIVTGNVFSIEPGIYIPSLYGARIEDIVAATDSGCETLNNVERELYQVA